MHFFFASQAFRLKEREREEKSTFLSLADSRHPISVLKNLDLCHLPVCLPIATPIGGAHWDMLNDSLAVPWVWGMDLETGF